VTRYQATEPDELTLEESDVINVFRKVSDGKSHFIHASCRKTKNQIKEETMWLNRIQGSPHS